MVKPKRKEFFLLHIFKILLKAIFRFIYVILAAAMIGFANAYYDENKWIKDLKGPVQQEQLFNDEEES